MEGRALPSQCTALGEEGICWREAGLPAESPPRGAGVAGPQNRVVEGVPGEKKQFKTRLFL